jgi:succinoglycan biosynthesis transport protein ExoP
VDLRRQFAIVRAWLPLLIATVAIAAGATYAISGALPKVYEAKARLNVGQSLSAVNPDYNQLLVSQRLSTTYAEIATTRPILEAVIRQLDLGMTPEELLRRVRADAPLDSTLLTITAEDADPSRAAAIANALAEQLIAATPAIQGRETDLQASVDADLQATRDQIKATQATVATLAGLTERTAAQEAELAALDDRLASLRSTVATLLSFSSGSASNLLTVIEPAVSPPAPISPKPLLNALLAAALGLLAAVGVVVLAEHLDDRIRDADVVQEVAGLSTLGMIARMKGDRSRSEIYRLVALLNPRSSVAEAYRALRTNIEFASVDVPIRTLLVTSSVPGEGKTTTASNLAIVFAQAGRRVLLLDADLRKPGVHQVFDLPNTHGLTTLLRDENVDLGAIVQSTEQDNLRVLTTGPLPPNPAELLGSQRMRATLDRLNDGNDLLILDSPPLQAVADAAILSSFIDGTLFVIDSARGRRGAVRQGREALTKAGANVVGAVLNRTPAGAHSAYADYYGAYGSEAGPDKSVRGAEESPGHATT